MDKYDITQDLDEQQKLIKISTLVPILIYRFPEVHTGFLYTLDIDTLDTIIENIMTITEEELLQYKK